MHKKESEIILIFGPRSLSSEVTEVRSENANSRRIEADGWRAVDGLQLRPPQQLAPQIHNTAQRAAA